MQSMVELLPRGEVLHPALSSSSSSSSSPPSEPLRVMRILSVLDGSLVLIATSTGAVVGFHGNARDDGDDDDDDASLPICIYREWLHCGPVYDLQVSTSMLVATAGHDATSCVFSLSRIYQRGSSATSTLHRCAGTHSLPLVAVRWMTDGTHLVSLSVDGDVFVHNVARGTSLAVARCRFSCRTMVFSADESCLFVGGTKLMCVDLLHHFRPSAESSPATFFVPPTSMMMNQSANSSVPGLYPCWWRPVGEHSEQILFEADASTSISVLRIDDVDGSLQAIFTKPSSSSSWKDDDDGGEHVVGRATWVANGMRCMAEGRWEVVDDRLPTMRATCATLAKPEHISAALMHVAALEGSAVGGFWRSATFAPVHNEDDAAPSCIAGNRGQLSWSCCVAATSSVEVPPAASTISWKLAEAKEEGRALQQSCDVLVAELRGAMRQSTST